MLTNDDGDGDHSDDGGGGSDEHDVNDGAHIKQI